MVQEINRYKSRLLIVVLMTYLSNLVNIMHYSASAIPQGGYAPRCFIGQSSGFGYVGNNLPSIEYKIKNYTPSMIHIPNPFLTPNRPYTQFVNCLDDIKDNVERIFDMTTGTRLPESIVIKVRKEIQSLLPIFNPEVTGFALNKSPIAEIFIKEDNLDRMLLTIGHEIGHVLTAPLDHIIDEEAKAFAFELAWLRAIKDNNIAGLGDSIRIPTPSFNGLHDVALNFVLSKMDFNSPLELFLKIANRKLSAKYDVKYDP